MNNREIDKIVSGIVDAKIEQLRLMPENELKALPKYTGIKFQAGGKDQELGVYHKVIESGSLFVAQCKNTHFLGAGSMFARGFILSTSGQISDAPEKIMWEYM